MNYFAQSYGLKLHDDDDLAEAKAILLGLRQQEQFAWEESQKTGDGK